MRRSNYLLYLSSAAALCAILTAGASAKPAYPGVLRHVQPDGSEIQITKRGDARAHAIYDLQGNLLIEDADGFLVKASPAQIETKKLQMQSAAARRAAAREDRATTRGESSSGNNGDDSDPFPIGDNGLRDKYIFAGAPFPSEGEPHAIVILVEFQNRHFSANDGANDYFTRMLNEEGFNGRGSIGSVRDWFIQNSDGKFKPVFDVYGPVMLDNKMEYYGENDFAGNDVRPANVIIEACRKLDDEIDFSKYDLNNDGYVDNVYVYYAGYGEADSNLSNTIWPHSATLREFFPGNLYAFDGKIVDRYGMSNESDYRTKRTDGIATFVHEFSHVLGLPDLYSTDYTPVYSPGSYSILDFGTYNNGGITPPNYSFFERMSLNWATPKDFTQSGDFSLANLADSNEAYIVRTSNPDEFFIFENRQLQGWDAFIPGHGMLAWHIDFAQHIWDQNVVNNTPSHQYVDLIEADNVFSDITQNADTFPGEAERTVFDFHTIPSLQSWGGKPTNVALSDISEDPATGLITFHAEVDASGVDEIIPDSASAVRIESGTIFNDGPEKAMLFSTAGAKVAEILPGASLSPAPGLYIIATPEASIKAVIK